jgi:hypothetical protein
MRTPTFRIGVNLSKNRRNTFFHHGGTETQSFYRYTDGMTIFLSSVSLSLCGEKMYFSLKLIPCDLSRPGDSGMRMYFPHHKDGGVENNDEF